MKKNKKRILKAALLISLCGLTSLAHAAEEAPKAPPKTVISSDRVEMDSQETVNVFNFYDNVHLEGEGLDAVCDKLEVISKKTGGESSGIANVESFEKITAIGNVHITQEGRDIRAGHAEIFPAEGKVVLTENPEVTDSQGTVKGHRIIFYKNDGKVYVEGSPEGGRPKIILPNLPDLNKKSEPGVKKVEKVEAQPAGVIKK